MKTLTTFLWGLILIGAAVIIMVQHQNLDGFWDWVYYAVGIGIGLHGIDKIDKSTE